MVDFENGLPGLPDMLPDSAINWITENVRQCKALEIGSGRSTYALLKNGCRLMTIEPDPSRMAQIADRMRELLPVQADKHNFVVMPAYRRPELHVNPVSGIDFILLNGNAAFPHPQQDWFHYAQFLSRGGHVMLNNLQVWSVRTLYDFLKAEPDWQIVWGNIDVAVFRLNGVFRPDNIATQQPHVVQYTKEKIVQEINAYYRRAS